MLPSIIKKENRLSKNDSLFNIRQQISAQRNKLRNYSTSIRDHFENSQENTQENTQEEFNDETTTIRHERTSVVVLTSLSGIYVWWPILFGGDDSLHLLLTQEDVPRFHDVAGDDHGHIYLTAPHERTVYRLQYSNGWWISNFSNHSVMNSIRSEMPLFLNIHYVPSILYVYGHSDVQIIDLMERPRARGSAPFMKRLRELSPNLRISDMIIDQLTSDGYIIGDSYGWCTVIRCSLNINDCVFLFKIPSSYDNRPYPCTGTIDFTKKIIYLSLEEKILSVHLNEQTNFDRRKLLVEKRGPRSTLGYDDIVTYDNVVLYTDVLRPVLYICTITNSNPCLNISLQFPPPQRSILPLRLSIVQVLNLQPPVTDNEDDTELHINQSATTTVSTQLETNKTTDIQRLIDLTTIAPFVHKNFNFFNIWMLIFGIIIGFLLAGLSFMFYYIICSKNRPQFKKTNQTEDSTATSIRNTSGKTPLLLDKQSNHYATESSTETGSDLTIVTNSSSSYHPEIVL